MVNIENLDDLKNSIRSIIVKDYGDFKRKTITYLNRYAENNKLSEKQEEQMKFMKWYIQFHPNLHLNETKQWTLDQVEKFQS